MGFLNPFLYQLPASAFQDVTIGDNTCTEDGCYSCSGYSAWPGWDATTGLGTPNISAIIAAALALP